MPRATVNVKDTTNYDLKTCPGGFVTLRRMTYGEIVQRRALMKLSVQASHGKKDDFKGEMAMASEEIAQYEFAHCIVDHNLEDENGNKLKLNTPVGFGQLDPRIGQEIEKYINEMNNLSEDEDENLLLESEQA